MSRSVQNRARRRAAQRQHALERLQQRHSADATQLELDVLTAQCADIYATWRSGARVSCGAVVTYEGADSVVVRVQWRTAGNWIKVVYSPVWGCLRTVLPPEPLPAWKQQLLERGA